MAISNHKNVLQMCSTLNTVQIPNHIFFSVASNMICLMNLKKLYERCVGISFYLFSIKDGHIVLLCPLAAIFGEKPKISHRSL